MRFIVFGDSKGKDDGINKKVLTRILKESSKLNPKPEFIVMGGDTVAGSSDEKILTFQLKKLRELIDKYYPNTPLIPVIGNHEVNIEPTDDRYEKSFSKVYRDLSPKSLLKGYNKTVYYMDFKDTRLIVLNAFHYGAIHKINKEQLLWFEKAASENIKNKFVFVHSPALPTGAHLGHSLDLYPENRDAFIKVALKCGVDIVFSGHEHNYSRRLINNPLNSKEIINQIITGGGGEKLRDKYKSKDGVIIAPKAVFHFIVVDIEKDFINISAINFEGKKIDEFRIDK